MINILGEIREWMEQTVSDWEFLPPVWFLADDKVAITIYTLNNGVSRSVHIKEVDEAGIVEIAIFDGESAIERPTYKWLFKNPLWVKLTNELFTYLKENNKEDERNE